MKNMNGIEIVSVDSSGNPGNSDSGAASISAHGRYVAFVSNATNLVPGVGIIDQTQIFIQFLT